jgi:hypothetical protein
MNFCGRPHMPSIEWIAVTGHTCLPLNELLWQATCTFHWMNYCDRPHMSSITVTVHTCLPLNELLWQATHAFHWMHYYGRPQMSSIEWITVTGHTCLPLNELLWQATHVFHWMNYCEIIQWKTFLACHSNSFNGRHVWPVTVIHSMEDMCGLSK